MTSRESILAAVKANQPETVKLPDIDVFETKEKGSLEKFASVLQGVGGKVAYVSGYPEIARTILAQYGSDVRIVSPVKELKDLSDENLEDIASIHDLRNVEVAVLNAHFGVAENGAVWITENEMQHRVLPFVTQHLAVVINAAAIVPTMHHAYDLIGKSTYGFGTFIAGPSKTADIEQSLVIGAHGPRSMTVFIIGNDNQSGQGQV
ncbi:LutC/YkgG family protein [Mucilaginibacter sp. X5P1]|uniref:LutC/YkgG family protein n=1 Tax=Mucilaginibacter sp. X5P1 TaxID=2723088 RepID=UPI00160BEEFB|nr:LUD domain-containing protein [Mucilaginibacter sp. X5P1]MBB6138670.1 L-lactate dehydrogenase complex protein LldG [Mucilaginibacter sp. X5P1]